MSSFFDDVVAWNEQTERNEQPSRSLRITCFREEYHELVMALLKDDQVGIAQECADLIWTVCGLAHGLGIPLNEVWAEVRRSNGDKIGADGEVLRREDGKILKPEGWTPPDIVGVLERHNVLSEERRTAF